MKMRLKMSWLGGLLALSIAAFFNACDQPSPVQLANGHTDAQRLRSLEGKIATLTAGVQAYPQASALILEKLPGGGFTGGLMTVENGSSFEVAEGACRPPLELPNLRLCQLTMNVDLDNEKQELLYTFGPSGSSFDPPADAWFDYKDLNLESAAVYYIDENGLYHKLEPEIIDLQQKRIKVRINHFSRYAISHSN